jgi:hypothetical protein
MKATAERGARFHPTVGIANPTGFTTSHPRAETTMSWDLRLSVCQCPGAKVAILPPCDHSLCVKLPSSPRVRPFQSFQPYALSSREVACGTIPLASDQAWRLYEWAVHHPIHHQAIRLPVCELLNFRASEPLLVLRASGVQIRCFYSWWKLTPLFQGALHHHRGLFSAHPLSAVLQ